MKNKKIQLNSMIKFKADLSSPETPKEPLETSTDIPKEMDIFYQQEGEFLPDGKTFADLTPEEVIEVRNKYRFASMKPGVYQGITGFGNMLN